MKGDFTRSTFRPQKHYSSVRMQQGRVQLDADWNEQIDITDHRVETEAADVIGVCGAPLDKAGFGFIDGAVPRLTAGHFYVDGILVENDKEVPINAQPFLPGFVLKKDAGDYLTYLDVWERYITAEEDELIREVALCGPDTSTRTQTVWQVRLIGPLPTGQNCLSEPDDWKKLINAVPGRLRAHTEKSNLPTNLCDIPAGAGYRRLENQLYRVEIHKPGKRGVATFKWSRDNGSILTGWTGQEGSDLIVQSIGKDSVLGFGPGQTVELTDDDRELRNEIGVLVKLGNVEGQVLTLDPAAPAVDRSTFGTNPKIRRWDSDGEIVTGPKWTGLEDGVEVLFEDGDFKTGDYWLIPARTAKEDVEWPPDETNPNNPAAVERQGIVHHYCKIGILHSNGTTFTSTDCRPLFPPLTGLLRFFYVGGGGQECLPNEPLPTPLQVGVTNGPKPVAGRMVRFVASAGTLDGGATNTAYVQTLTDGVARCTWKLNPGGPHDQTVTATLLDVALQPTTHPSIVFTANLSLASQVAYDPQKCSNLSTATTVQQAIDLLCQMGGEGEGCCKTVGELGDFKTLDEALNKLLKEQKERQVCLCILPGDQAQSNGFQNDLAEIAPHANLEIRGCAESLLDFQEPLFLRGFGSVRLTGLTLRAPNFGAQDGMFVFNECGLVEIDDCTIRGMSATGSLLRFDGGDEIIITDSRLALVQPGKKNKAGDIFAATPLGEMYREGIAPEEALNIRNGVINNLKASPKADRQLMVEAINVELENNKTFLSKNEVTGYKRLVRSLAAVEVNPNALANALDAINAAAEAPDTPGAVMILSDAQAEVAIQNNLINGIVCLYGPPPYLTGLDAIKEISGHLREASNNNLDVFTHRTSLNLRGNKIRQVLLTEKLQNPDSYLKELGGMFESLFVSDNTFNQLNNYFLSLSSGFTNNFFAFRQRGDIAAAIAETLTITGNRAVVQESRFWASAADIQAVNNARIVVQQI